MKRIKDKLSSVKALADKPASAKATADKPASAKATADKVKKALEKIRPALQADGGDVEFMSWDKKTGKVEVKLKGMCVGCPMAQLTLKQGIEAEVKKAVPEVKEVING